MRVWKLRGLDEAGTYEKSLNKVFSQLARGDLRSCDVKKLSGSAAYYRARLDYASRLLLQFGRYRGEMCAFALEVIEGHAYERSRFLRGAAAQPELGELEGFEEIALSDTVPIRYLPEERPGDTPGEFRYVGGPLVLDGDQEAALHGAQGTSAWVLVGGAGSGKTAVVLAWMAECPGRIAYVTHSRALAARASVLWGEQTREGVAFVPFAEVVGELAEGPLVNFAAFRQFAMRYAPALAPLRLRAREHGLHALYEEFRGVLGASRPAQPLTLTEYETLGVRESIFLEGDRPHVYAAFLAYREWLGAAGYVDPNFVVPRARPGAEGWETLVVDEVQDFTPAELQLLRVYTGARQLALAGDANQMIHPNFFSWARLRAALSETSSGPSFALHRLPNNYRNARAVTTLAERLLRLKHARFGSVDRESDLLPVAAGDVEPGVVRGLVGTVEALRTLDEATHRSATVAVVVLRDEDKVRAAAIFRTPLVFAVHEAKGLEFDTVVLFEFAASADTRMAELVLVGDAENEAGIGVEKEGDLPFRRRRDKEDRTPERLRFYANALYVAVTRAVRRVLLVEPKDVVTHPLYAFLGIAFDTDASLDSEISTLTEWAKVAERLHAEGRDEQAAAVREQLAREEAAQEAKKPATTHVESVSAPPVRPLSPVPWEVLDGPALDRLIARASERGLAAAKRERAQKRLAEVAYLYEDLVLLRWLAGEGYAKALPKAPGGGKDAYGPAIVKERKALVSPSYVPGNEKAALAEVDKYGLEHRSTLNLTPLMQAAVAGNVELTRELLRRGADRYARDTYGRTALGCAWATALVFGVDRLTFHREHAANFFLPMHRELAPPRLSFRMRGRSFVLEHHEPIYWIYACFEIFSRLSAFRSTESLMPCTPRELGPLLQVIPEALWPRPRTEESLAKVIYAHGPTSNRPLFGIEPVEPRDPLLPTLWMLKELFATTDAKGTLTPMPEVTRVSEVEGLRAATYAPPPMATTAPEEMPFTRINETVAKLATLSRELVDAVYAYALFHDDLVLATACKERGAAVPPGVSPSLSLPEAILLYRKIAPEGPINRFGRDPFGTTPLMRAVIANNLRMVTALAPTSDLLARDAYGRTAYSWLLSANILLGDSVGVINHDGLRHPDAARIASLVRPKEMLYLSGQKHVALPSTDIAFYLQAVVESCFRPVAYRSLAGRSGSIQAMFLFKMLEMVPKTWFGPPAPALSPAVVLRTLRAHPQVWVEIVQGEFLPNPKLMVPWDRNSRTHSIVRSLGIQRLESLAAAHGR